MKSLSCGDIVAGCAYMVRGATEEEILAQAGRHAVDAHGLTVTPEVVEVVRAHIREDEPPAPKA